MCSLLTMMIFQVSAFTFFLFAYTGYAKREEHLCNKIKSGNFESILIKSISFNDYNSLEIWEGDNTVYSIPADRISSDGIDMNGVPVIEYEKHPSMGPILLQLPAKERKTIKAVYMFKLKKSSFLFCIEMFGNDCYRHGMLVITEWTEYMFNVYKGEVVLVWEQKKADHGNFAIVHSQTRDGKVRAYGFVKDTYKGTKFDIMHSLSIPVDSLEIEGLLEKEPDNIAKAAARFFYLQKANQSDQAELVNHVMGTVSPDSTHQLILFTPKGFMAKLDGAYQLFLFDSNAGCVYHFDGWDDMDLDELHEKMDSKLLLHRRSFPYEYFFRCSGFGNLTAKFVHPSGRCFGNLSVPIPTDFQNCEVGVSRNLEYQKPSQSYTFLIVCGVVLLAGVVVVAFFVHKSMQTSSGKKSGSKQPRAGKTATGSAPLKKAKKNKASRSASKTSDSKSITGSGKGSKGTKTKGTKTKETKTKETKTKGTKAKGGTKDKRKK